MVKFSEVAPFIGLSIEKPFMCTIFIKSFDGISLRLAVFDWYNDRIHHPVINMYDTNFHDRIDSGVVVNNNKVYLSLLDFNSDGNTDGISSSFSPRMITDHDSGLNFFIFSSDMVIYENSDHIRSGVSGDDFESEEEVCKYSRIMSDEEFFERFKYRPMCLAVAETMNALSIEELRDIANSVSYGTGEVSPLSNHNISNEERTMLFSSALRMFKHMMCMPVVGKNEEGNGDDD